MPVLVIDDDIEVLKTILTMFDCWQKPLADPLTGESPPQQHLPFEIRIDTATSGEEALGMVESKQYAVAIVDMRMPGGLDGVETAREILAINPKIRIVYITAYTDYSLEALQQRVGTNFAYIKKPFDHEVLIQTTLVLANDWQRECRLLKAEREARAAREAKDEFLASMSHELRTPLTAIIGNSELLARKLTGAEEREILRSIEIAGRTQLSLVNDIMDHWCPNV